MDAHDYVNFEENQLDFILNQNSDSGEGTIIRRISISIICISRVYLNHDPCDPQQLNDGCHVFYFGEVLGFGGFKAVDKQDECDHGVKHPNYQQQQLVMLKVLNQSNHPIHSDQNHGINQVQSRYHHLEVINFVSITYWKQVH